MIPIFHDAHDVPMPPDALLREAQMQAEAAGTWVMREMLEGFANDQRRSAWRERYVAFKAMMEDTRVPLVRFQIPAPPPALLLPARRPRKATA